MPYHPEFNNVLKKLKNLTKKDLQLIFSSKNLKNNKLLLSDILSLNFSYRVSVKKSNVQMFVIKWAQYPFVINFYNINDDYIIKVV